MNPNEVSGLWVASGAGQTFYFTPPVWAGQAELPPLTLIILTTFPLFVNIIHLPFSIFYLRMNHQIKTNY